MNRRTFPSPIGPLSVTEEGRTITEVAFRKKASSGDFSPLLRRAEEELQEYFRGTRTTFSVPMRAKGTAFQRAVWAAMTKVPYGTTATYGALARKIGRAKAARAVGAACGKNPLPVLVPCHRVLGTQGLGGFSGGIGKKKILLDLEGDAPAVGRSKK